MLHKITLFVLPHGWAFVFYTLHACVQLFSPEWTQFFLSESPHALVLTKSLHILPHYIFVLQSCYVGYKFLLLALATCNLTPTLAVTGMVHTYSAGCILDLWEYQTIPPFFTGMVIWLAFNDTWTGDVRSQVHESCPFHCYTVYWQMLRWGLFHHTFLNGDNKQSPFLIPRVTNLKSTTLGSFLYYMIIKMIVKDNKCADFLSLPKCLSAKGIGRAVFSVGNPSYGCAVWTCSDISVNWWKYNAEGFEHEEEVEDSPGHPSILRVSFPSVEKSSKGIHSLFSIFL